MNAFTSKMIDAAESIPETKGILSVTAPSFGASVAANSSFVRVTLDDPENRNRTQMEIVDSLTKVMQKETEARIFISRTNHRRSESRIAGAVCDSNTHF
ncbi:MAG: hypothetical protein IPG18_00155 [Saprospiraceae bacterium]|nr:hypothetical protein [Saprospiraceae bacterium]